MVLLKASGTIPLATQENYLWLKYKAFKRLGVTANKGLILQVKEIIG